MAPPPDGLKARPSLHLYAVCLILLVSLVLVGFVVPGPTRFPLPPGTPPPVASIAPRCLAIQYARGHDRYMPTAFRLTTSVDAIWGHFGDYHVAQGVPGVRLWSYAGWRLAGSDSLDIVWHHSDMIRLPIAGDSMVGRAAYPDPGSLLRAIANRDAGYEVRAHTIDCRSIAWPVLP